MATLTGTPGNDSLVASGSYDLLFGLAGDDTLVGGPGQNFFDGGSGADLMIGGPSFDRYIVDSLGDVVVEDNTGPDDGVTLAGLAGARYNLPRNIEYLWADAAFDEPVDVLGNELNNFMMGGPRNDRLEGAAGNDTLEGASGRDTLVGGAGSDLLKSGSSYSSSPDPLGDLLDGGDGDDTLRGSDGDDTLRGGDGQDSLIGERGRDLLDGGAGNDEIAGGGRSTVLGGAGDDMLFGSEDALLDGGAGNDVLAGFGANVTLQGGLGDDLYRVLDTRATLIERTGEGVDLLELTAYNAGRYTLPEHIEQGRLIAWVEGVVLLGNALNNLLRTNGGGTIDGGPGDDSLVGSTGADTLLGGSGADSLDGDFGNDVLEGGAGDDTLLGGYGNDTLMGGPGFDELDGGAGDDVYILDDRDDFIDEQPDHGNDTLRIIVNGAKVDVQNIEHIVYANDALPLAYWVDALTFGFSWQPMGLGGVVNYAFAASDADPSFLAFGAGDRDATRKALALWVQGTQLQWREVPAGQADVLFGYADLSASGGAGLTAFLPSDEAVHVYIDLDGVGNALSDDASWNAVLVHEIGHAIGLKHPGNYNGAVGPGTPPYLSAAEDSTRFTLMSYNEVPPRDASDFVTELPALDRATAQYLYGVAPGQGGGNTLYRFSQLAWPNSLISDGSGVDTLDASDVPATPGAAVDMTIDLRAGARNFAGSAAALISAPGQVAINYGSVIEHAIGSAGRDRIFGNEADNSLVGGGGSDTLNGSAGDDTLDGGDANDELDGGPGSDRLLGGAGDDLLRDGGGESNVLSGGDGNDRIVFSVTPGQAGAAAIMSTVSGGAGSDVLVLQFAPTAMSLELARTLLGLRDGVASTQQSATLGLAWSGLEQLEWRDMAGAALPNFKPYTLVNDVTMAEDTSTQGRVTAFDFEGDVLSFSLQPNTYYGSFDLRADGSYTFTPPAEFNGKLFFSYVVSDGRSSAAPAQLVFTVTPVDDAPQLQWQPGDINALVGQNVDWQVIYPPFNDGDSPVLSYSASLASGQPLPAWLHFDAARIAFSGTPAAGDAGVRNLRITASADGNRSSLELTLGVHASPNRLPQAGTGALLATEDKVFVGRLPVATDADGDAISYTLLAGPYWGTLQLQADGQLRYAPKADTSGVDRFTYRLRDGRGGSVDVDQLIEVQAVNDPASGVLQISGSAEIGQQVFAMFDVSDPDGGRVTDITWWLGETMLPRQRYGQNHWVSAADAGGQLSFRASFEDGLGNVEVLRSPPVAVPALALVRGTAGSDLLQALYTPSSVVGGEGNDTLLGATACELLDGGAGNDSLVCVGGFGSIFDGGGGFDVLAIRGAPWPAAVDLKSGRIATDYVPILLRNIEGVIGTDASDSFIGLDGPAEKIGEAFRPMAGRDTIDGGTGIDTVEYLQPRGTIRFARDADTIRFALDENGVSQQTLIHVERIRFDDTYLAFGQRADDVAKVGFALWSKGIAGSKDLFAKGISYYDNGYSVETLVATAITYFAADSDAQLAQRLVDNVPSTHNAAELLTLLGQHGGGNAGRAYITQLMANEAGNLANIELAGLRSQGIECSLGVDGVLFFPLMPG